MKIFINKIRGALLALVCFIGSMTPVLAQEAILLSRPQSEQDTRLLYPRALLESALAHTVDAYGDYRLEYTKVKLQWERAREELKQGKGLHVISAATRKDWEAELLPVRIPVMKGLLGYRIFLIRKEDQPKFAQIRNLDELKQLNAGSGKQWSITPVFQHNQFKLVTGSSYEGLFSMLVGRRFDYFPRGINEAPQEYAARKDQFPTLHIEENLMLRLYLPVYFFVTPKRPQLAERIEEGLNRMIADGTFDQVFFKYHKELLESVNLQNRRSFAIENPNLSPLTPLERKELWLDPGKLPQ